jgi:hypothetical protein
MLVMLVTLVALVVVVAVVVVAVVVAGHFDRLVCVVILFSDVTAFYLSV